MDKNNTLDWEVIRQKIEGKLSDAGQKALEDWEAGDNRRKKFLQAVEKYYAKGTLPEVSEEQIDHAWGKFYGSRHRGCRIFYKRTLQWGIAALIFVVLGTSMLWYKFYQSESPSAEVVATILPGKNKASLILSTGKIIELQTGALHQLADRQVDIRMDSAGISYQTTGTSDQIYYNTLQIPHGGEYCLALSDGTRIWLNAETELSYPVAFVGNERRVKLKGEAYFEVAQNLSKPFIVETDQMEVKVVGTSFNVNAYANEPEIVTTLVTGSVQIQNSDRPVRVLQPSEQALWNRTKGDVSVRKVNTVPYTQWREGKFIFRDNDLETIFRILARWYDMEYEFLQPELKAERFYGVTGRYENVNELLRQFEKTGKVRFSLEGKKVIIKK